MRAQPPWILAAALVIAIALLAAAGCGGSEVAEQGAVTDQTSSATAARTAALGENPGTSPTAPARTIEAKPATTPTPASDPAPAPKPSPRYTDSSPEYFLAVIDGRSTEDASLDRYRRLIDGIRQTCKGNRIRIADQAVNVKQLVEKNGGPTEPVIAHLRQMRTAVDVPELGAGRDCTDIFAAYVLLRVGGE